MRSNGSDDPEFLLLHLLGEKRFPQACKEILTRYRSQLLRFLRLRLPSGIEPEDLFQDLSLIVYERLPDFRGDSTLRTWLYAIACHLSANRFNRPSRQNVRLDTTKQANLPQRSASSWVHAEWRNRVFEECLAELTSEQRTIVLLRTHGDGFSFREIGTITGIDEAAAKQRYHRAKQRLKVLLEQRGIQPGGQGS